jgi:cytochrome c-type protein NapC
MITSEFQQSRKKWWIWGIFMFSGGILFSGIFTTVVDMTNTTEFCTSCHTMTTNLEELKTTAHYNNASGVTVGCPDCHVPHALGPKLWAKLIATKDIYHEIIGTIDTREKYEANRWRLANRVWEKMKATQSRECRHCHSFEHMDLSAQDRFARKKHERAVDREETCIDCHQGIAHELPDEPDENTEIDS